MALQLFKIASVTVGSAGSSTIDFTSIPQGYTDLCLKLSLRETNASIDGSCFIQFNGSGTVPTVKYLQGNGAGPTSGTTTSYVAYIDAANDTANTFGNADVYIPNYTSSNYKSYSTDSVAENNAATSYMMFVAGLWSVSSAINQITLTPSSTKSFVQYSTATLYGIL
jgi:hypothetical protein